MYYGKVVPRRVVCAAIKLSNGIIICGVRHFDGIMRANIKAMGSPRWANAEQGFIDQQGKFMDRKEALSLAKINNQIIRRCGGDEYMLSSENLY